MGNIQATGAKVKKLIAKKDFELADYVRKKIGEVGSGKDYYQSGPKCLPHRVGCATDVAVPHEQFHRPCLYCAECSVFGRGARVFAAIAHRARPPKTLKENFF